MADFQTIAGEFAVRVNDGMSWVVYHIRAATERDAHVLAQRLWGQRAGYRVAHTEETMPEPVNADAVDLEHHEDGPEVDWPAGEQVAALNILPEPEPSPETSGSTAKASSASAASATAGGSSTSATSGTKSSTSATSGGSSTSIADAGSGSSTTPAGGGRTTSA